MLQMLKRHPLAITAFFRHALVLTYALPQEILRPLLPPGLLLDTYGNYGFIAIAMVQTEALRPAGLPRIVGQDFFLAGYRLFARYRSLRGLRILRTASDHRFMVFAGNLLTRYNYSHADVAVSESAERLEIEIQTPRAAADLHVIADMASAPAALPGGSPFKSLKEARRFAGPLPYTFEYESGTDSMIIIKGVRRKWNPQPVQVDVLRNTFFDQSLFCQAKPILANAFHVRNIPYRWQRGVVEKLSNGKVRS